MSRKELLIKIFRGAQAANCTHVAVGVETRGYEGLEIIINPVCNLEEKLKYYQSAYDDNMILKSFDGIRIVSACGVFIDNSFKCIDEILQVTHMFELCDRIEKEE